MIWFFFFLFFFFKSILCMKVLPANKKVHQVGALPEEARRGHLISLKLKVRMVVSCHMYARN